ncbi:hypothetical protein K491DRAFT_709448 [Lophiostoma macrostomum CBS 122681]|uniref:Uncharacterized protein n=1 Tax=Lophiostoma macrostomum CBS 122681 TaxID=1314788 RepID=A0A6A6TRV9_9PLEO|nr:hypothetical protein K491DRAFT_709448 [Lophiostoma macrostomum CBS 122681]
MSSSPLQSSSPLPSSTYTKRGDNHERSPLGTRKQGTNKDVSESVGSQLEDFAEGDRNHSKNEDSFDASLLSSSPIRAQLSEEIGEGSYIDDSGESFVNHSRESFAHNNEESFVTDAEKSVLEDEGQSILSEDVSYDDSLGHDDARDVMNMPPSYVAPSHRPHDLHNVFAGDRELLEHEVEQLKQRRQQLEAEIDADRKAPEQNSKEVLPHIGSTPTLRDLQEQAGAVSLTEGVVAIDPDQLDKILANPEHNAVSYFAEDSAPLTPGATAAIDPDQLEKILSSPESPSPPASPAMSTPAQATSLIPGPLVPSSSPAAVPVGQTPRAAVGPATPSPMQIALPSSIGSTSPTRTRANSTPTRQVLGAGARRVSFTDDPIVSETPFTGALKHFKTYQNATKTKSIRNKENSPSKSRRNASLPEEIAELAKEIDEGIEDAKDTLMLQQRREAVTKAEAEADVKAVGLDFELDLEKYREADLAPLDPVREDKRSGDSSMAGTPVKSTLNAFKKYEDEQRVQAGLLGTASPGHNDGLGHDFNNASPKATATTTMGNTGTVMLGQSTTSVPTKYELSVPDHTGGIAKLKIESNASPQQIGEYIRQKGMELDAREADIDDAVQSFLDEPESFVVVADRDTDADTAGACDHIRDEHPVFIKIISLLPGALLWGTVAPIVKYTSAAYDTVMRKLVGLTLGGGEKVEIEE